MFVNFLVSERKSGNVSYFPISEHSLASAATACCLYLAKIELDGICGRSIDPGKSFLMVFPAALRIPKKVPVRIPVQRIRDISEIPAAIIKVRFLYKNIMSCFASECMVQRHLPADRRLPLRERKKGDQQAAGPRPNPRMITTKIVSLSLRGGVFSGISVLSPTPTKFQSLLDLN